MPGQDKPLHAPSLGSGKNDAGTGATTQLTPPKSRDTMPADGESSPSAIPLESSHANRGDYNHDFFSSPNSTSTTTPHSAFSPVLASPSPGTSTSPETDSTCSQQPLQTGATVEPSKAHTIAAQSSQPKTPPVSARPGSSACLGSNEDTRAINAGASSTTGCRDLQSLQDGRRSVTASTGEKSNPSLKSNNLDTQVNTTTNTSPTRLRLSRPKPSRPQLQGLNCDIHSLHSFDSPRSAVGLSRASSIRSVCSNAPLQHPTPELNAKSGAYTGNVAALEATAERFSMTSSIEDAIRNAHTQLKRRDSQRSTILAANLQQQNNDNCDGGSVTSDAPLPTYSRHLSIASLNSGARLGGYSPSGYVMSPTHSMSMTRMRSASKASSTGPPSSVISDVIPEDSSIALNDDGLVPPHMISRHGPGKSSVRSVMSNKKLSLAEIAENEPPTSLTREALNEADHLPSPIISESGAEQSTIRLNPAQLAQMGLEQRTPRANGHWDDNTPNAETWSHRPKLDMNGEWDASEDQRQVNDASMGYFPQQEARGYYQGDGRDTSTLSGPAYETETHYDAFGDFDGVHCDPNQADFDGPLPTGLGEDDYHQQQKHHEQILQQPQDVFMQNPEEMSRRSPPPPPPVSRPQQRRYSERPQSYFDPSTGHDMLYYPAPVPAMLNLPPKLSNKPKTAVRHARYSRVLETMVQESRAQGGRPHEGQPQESRASRIWLADPVAADESNTNFMGETQQNEPSHDQTPEPTSGQPSASPTKSEFQHKELRRPAKLRDAENRMSRMSMMPSEVPPQLRASAFFDLPSAAPRIELLGGSAMHTLDSILDASAHAPVSAFTDHSFAGKLGEEVYGQEKKKKKKKRQTQQLSVANIDEKRDSVSTVREIKERSSFLGIIGGGKGRDSNAGSDRNSAVLSPKGSTVGDGASQKRPRSDGGEGDIMSPTTAMLAPGEDEHDSSSEADEDGEDDDEEDEDDVYLGAPTTLLAELQLRKHQQKLRTRPINKAHPNGLHTTLLELDAVAEVERKNRQGKRINLAWEDPSLAQADMSDDEDIPLAVLQAMRGNPAGDISAVVADVHRPLGLMERREMEDNEPLSRRRDRIQGRETMQPNPVYLNTVSQTRASQLTFSPGVPNLHPMRQSQLHLGAPVMQMAPDRAEPESDDEEIEDEPLGDRMRRLKARDDKRNALPLARPVSAAFTAELLSHLGVDEKEEGEKQAKNTPAPEEEETLGQRRRRLQAEREAREQEMNVNASALHALTGGADLGARTMENGGYNRLSKKISLADVLAVHPASDAKGHMDPREAERLRLQAEAERAAREHEGKMRTLRAQQSHTQLSSVGDNPRGVGVPTSIGIGAQRQVSGFMGGRFNDGAGGGTALPIGAARDGPGHGSWGGNLHQGRHVSMYGQPTPAMYGVGFPAAAGQHQYAPSAYGYGQAYGQMHMPGAQQDRVEKWRQGIL